MKFRKIKHKIRHPYVRNETGFDISKMIEVEVEGELKNGVLTVNPLCSSLTRANSNRTIRLPLASPSLMAINIPSEVRECSRMESSQGAPHYSFKVMAGLTHSHG
jgi:hypothetical protein